MAFTTNLNREIPDVDGDDNAWGTINNATHNDWDSVLGGVTSKSVSAAGTTTLTEAESLPQRHVYTGTLTATALVLLSTRGRLNMLRNETVNSGATDYQLTAQPVGGTGVVIPKLANALVWSNGTNAFPVHALPIEESFIIAASDETTALATGTNKAKFRVPRACTIVDVRASLSTAQTSTGSGGLVTVDVNKNGTTILSTKLTFDNGEKTTTTAATPAVISDTALAADDEVEIDVDTIGDGTAAGLKVCLLVRRTGLP